MPYQIDETHDPNLESWVESANDPETDFPIQNLPVCLGARPGASADLVLPCVVIGDQMLGIATALQAAADHAGYGAQLAQSGASGWMRGQRDLSAFTTEQKAAVRRAISGALRRGSRAEPVLRKSLFPINRAMLLPIARGAGPRHEDSAIDTTDYTDFYASIHHATNVGSMFRPDNPLLPNYKHIPIGYHGRVSSIVPSGTDVRRPIGQQAPTEEGGSPSFGPCKMLDYELEMGWVVGRGNTLGEPIPIEDAEDHVLGLSLVNDWSARDIQKWEYQPLGPFLAKSFATTVSPFIVTMEALAPFRCPAFERAAGDPQPLPYLDSPANREHGGIDITVEAWLSSAQMRTQDLAPVRLSRGSFKHMYWTIAQMLTHHASNGCNLQPGDLMASGTISGPTRDARGCLLELTWDGDPWGTDPTPPGSGGKPKIVPGTQRTPIELPTGEARKFLEDGDEVILKAYCEREGFRRIGFGECRGVVAPAKA